MRDVLEKYGNRVAYTFRLQGCKKALEVAERDDAIWKNNCSISGTRTPMVTSAGTNEKDTNGCDKIGVYRVWRARNAISLRARS